MRFLLEIAIALVGLLIATVVIWWYLARFTFDESLFTGHPQETLNSRFFIFLAVSGHLVVAAVGWSLAVTEWQSDDLTSPGAVAWVVLVTLWAVVGIRWSVAKVAEPTNQDELETETSDRPLGP